MCGLLRPGSNRLLGGRRDSVMCVSPLPVFLELRASVVPALLLLSETTGEDSANVITGDDDDELTQLTRVVRALLRDCVSAFDFKREITVCLFKLAPVLLNVLFVK